MTPDAWQIKKMQKTLEHINQLLRLVSDTPFRECLLFEKQKMEANIEYYEDVGMRMNQEIGFD